MIEREEPSEKWQVDGKYATVTNVRATAHFGKAAWPRVTEPEAPALTTGICPGHCLTEEDHRRLLLVTHAQRATIQTCSEEV